MKRTQNHTYDIIVAGGGQAGCAAAIAAARRGSKVLLIEQSASLGGMGTNGLVPCYAPFDDGKKPLYGGITYEIMECNNVAFGGEKYRHYTNWPLIAAEKLKFVLDTMVSESGCDILFNTFVCDAVVENGNIKYITAVNKSGFTDFYAQKFIDCTGDADVAALADVPFQVGNEYGEVQASSLCFTITGINTEGLGEIYGKAEGSVVKQMIASGKYPEIKGHDHMVTCLIAPNTIIFNAGHIHLNNLNAEETSAAYLEGRKMADAFLRGLKEFLPDHFENAQLIQTAPTLGTRESRRIEGEYTLTYKDYFDRKVFEDEICRNHYWIDAHPTKTEFANGRHSATEVPVMGKAFEPGESHGIPFRSLLPKVLDNLLVAGRTISCDRYALAAVRVMPNCLATGEAAGVAAAIASKQNIGFHALSTDELRTELRKNGAHFE